MCCEIQIRGHMKARSKVLGSLKTSTVREVDRFWHKPPETHKPQVIRAFSTQVLILNEMCTTNAQFLNHACRMQRITLQTHICPS